MTVAADLAIAQALDETGPQPRASGVRDSRREDPFRATAGQRGVFRAGEHLAAGCLELPGVVLFEPPLLKRPCPLAPPPPRQADAPVVTRPRAERSSIPRSGATAGLDYTAGRPRASSAASRSRAGTSGKRSSTRANCSIDSPYSAATRACSLA